MKEIVGYGSLSRIEWFYIQDTTTGGGKTALAFNTSELRIDIGRPGDASATSYTVASGNIETIAAIGTYVAPTADKVRFKEIDSVSLPGWYEVQFADALYNNTGSRKSLCGMIHGATGAAPTPFQIQLDLSETTVGLTAGAIQAIWDALTSALTTVGSIGKWILDNLNAPVSNLGTGARTVTPRVQTSGGADVQGARVRYTKGAESFSALTDVNGQVVSFNLDDGTWVVSITAVGYSFAGTTLVVDGNKTPTYVMTTNNVSAPSSPDLSVGTLLCLGTDEQPEPEVAITYRKISGPGVAGYSLDSEERTVVSDEDGIVEAEFQIGATYKVRRGVENSPFTREVSFGPVADAASFNLPEHLGKP